MRARLALLGAFFLALWLQASATVAINNQWSNQGHGSCASGCAFSVTVSPNTAAGTVEIFTIYTYDSGGCPSSVVMSPGTWTASGTPVCSGSRGETYTFWHVPQAGETSYTATVTNANGTQYFAANVNEVTGANTTTPFDVAVVYATPSGAPSITAPGVTTTQNGDMLFANWGNATYAAKSVTTGWSGFNFGGSSAVFGTTATQVQSSAGADTAPAATYTAAPGNYIVTWAAAVAPTATASPTPVPVPVKITTEWHTAAHSASCGSGCAFNLTVTPTQGTLQVLTVYAYDSGGCPSAIAITPATWTQVGTSACSGVRGESYVFWKLAGSSETTYTATITNATGTQYAAMEDFQLAGANLTTPFDVVPSFASSAGGTTVQAPGITTLQANDLVFSNWGFAVNGPASGITAPWGMYNYGSGTQVFGVTAYNGYPTAGAVTGPTATFAGNSSTGTDTWTAAIAPSPTPAPGRTSALLLTWSGAIGPGGNPVPTPSPTVAPSGAPPLSDWAAWFDLSGVTGMTNPSATDVNNFGDWCIGGGSTDAAGVAITSCGSSFMYSQVYAGEMTTSGSDSSWPWHQQNPDSGKAYGSATSNCPNNMQYANFFAHADAWETQNGPNWTTSDSTNWGNFTPGGTIGNVANMGAGWTGSVYRFYLNLNSSTLQDFIQAEINNCQYANGGAGVNADAMTGSFNDNFLLGLQSQNGSIWDNLPSGKNFGTGSSSPFADPTFGSSGGNFSPSAFFNGSAHTRTTLITSTDTPTATYTTDTAYRTAEGSYTQHFFHADGTTPWYMLSNTCCNNDTTLITQTHELGQIMEEYLDGCFCAGGSQANSSTPGMIYIQAHNALNGQLSAFVDIDQLAAGYNDGLVPGTNPNIHIGNLDDLYGTGTLAEGGASHQQALRWHFYVPWLMSNDTFPNLWVSWLNACATSGCVNVYGGDFVMFSGRYQAMPADANSSGVSPCGELSSVNYNHTGHTCNAKGARDPAIGCASATSGLWCVEYAHMWVEFTDGVTCTQFSQNNWTATCVHDIGPALVLVNNSTTNVTVSAANLQSWAPHVYNSISSGHVVAMCSPNSSYFNWTSGTTHYVYLYASGTTSVNVCNSSTGNDFNTGGAPTSGDAVDHSTALSTVLNDTLTVGQGLVIVP